MDADNRQHKTLSIVTAGCKNDGEFNDATAAAMSERERCVLIHTVGGASDERVTHTKLLHLLALHHQSVLRG